MLFIDLDSFREDMPYSELLSYMNSVRQVSSEIFSDLLHYSKT